MPSLGSQDSVEDAVEALENSPFHYILFTGTHSTHTRIDSNLDADARAMLLDWVRSGDMERLLLEHFERNPLADDSA